MWQNAQVQNDIRKMIRQFRRRVLVDVNDITETRRKSGRECMGKT